MVSRVGFVLAALGAASAQANDGFDFLSIGDWGDVGAKTITKYMAQYDPKFVLSIGDNFYSDGVKSTSDPQFKNKFEDTFSAPSLQVPWYICAGNHDYYGGTKGINAEMDYSKLSDRWTYPSLYFDKVETGSDGTSVHLLSIDTWRLNGGDTYVKFDPVSGRAALKNVSDIEFKYQTGVMEKAKRDVLLKMFEEENENDPVEVQADDIQLQWIEKTMAASTSDWLVVMGHFPVYSCTTGEHGDTKSLVDNLAPVLSKYNDVVYFNGHDHIMQHIQRAGVNYFGNGAGARTHTGINSNYNGLKGAHTGHMGFMYHHVNKTAFETVFRDDQGAKPYSYTITKTAQKTKKPVHPMKKAKKARKQKMQQQGIGKSSE